MTGVKHRCRAQDKRWGDGVGSGAAVSPDGCAGAAAALLGRVPWARMAHCDVTEGWTEASPSDGLRCHQAMDCDIPERCIVTRHPSLLIFGRRVSPSRLVPALQLSEFARCGALSEAFGAGVVLGE